MIPRSGVYSLMVRTTEAVGRVLTVGSFSSLKMISSYEAMVWTG